MCAIPTSDMTGYSQLHDRVCSALDRCQESQAIEFKESADWESLKLRVIKTILAMGNLRDGGIIIIGASERNDTWDLTGIAPEHLATYDFDDITDAINRYASPPIQIDIVLVTYNGDKTFLALQAKEFESLPYVCQNNAPNGSKLLRKGEVYVRPPGKPQTKRITDAQEMADLLELVAEKRARSIISTSRRIGFAPPPDDSQYFDRELGGL
jgi:predicted HTH transcriptional regulator